jgi:hypothetical protein
MPINLNWPRPSFKNGLTTASSYLFWTIYKNPRIRFSRYGEMLFLKFREEKAFCCARAELRSEIEMSIRTAQWRGAEGCIPESFGFAARQQCIPEQHGILENDCRRPCRTPACLDHGRGISRARSELLEVVVREHSERNYSRWQSKFYDCRARRFGFWVSNVIGMDLSRKGMFTRLLIELERNYTNRCV